MNRRFAFLAIAAAIVVAACTENQPVPTAPSATSGLTQPPKGILQSTAAPQCQSVDASQATVDSLLPQLFSPGQGRRGQAQNFSNQIVQARRQGNTALAQVYMDSLINFTLQNYYAGNLVGGQGTDTQARVVAFIYALYCANSISPIPDLSGIFASQNTVFLQNNSPTTEVTTPGNNGGVIVKHGDVPDSVNGQPFFGTFVSVVQTTDPLPTSLDWYGLTGFRQGAFEFVATPPVNFTTPVLTGVCISFDNAVVTSPNDLRLAHRVQQGFVPVVAANKVVTTAGGTIEILAPTSTSPLGLSCTPLSVAAGTRFGRALEWLASAVLPKQLLAIVSGGGIGGQADNFSPFAAVDTKLNASGTGPASPQFIPVGSDHTTAPVSVSVTTRNNANPVDGVSVGFAPSASFAPPSANTGTDGKASSTWTIVAGANNATAAPAEAPLVIPTVSFSVTAIQLTPLSIGTTSLPGGQQTVAYGPVTLTASGGTGTFTWALSPGSAPLPGGITLSTAGVVSGTPTVFGSFTFSVRVTSGPLTQDKSFTIAVQPPPVVISTASPLPSGSVGTPYSQSLTATGGDGTYLWAQTAGSLPAGLSLSGNGVLSGTPTVPGTSTFTAQVSSAGGTLTASQAFSVTIGYPSSFAALTFQPGPSSTHCYALNAILAPNIAVLVTTPGGMPVTGVEVDIIAVTNNGSKVAVSQPAAITGPNGLAVFNTLSINKTGAYHLIAGTGAPWPVTTVQSGKFNISPSC
jgi:hypothetical protein